MGDVISDSGVSEQHDIIIIIIICITMATAGSRLQPFDGIVDVVDKPDTTSVLVSTHQQVMYWTATHYQHLRTDVHKRTCTP